MNSTDENVAGRPSPAGESAQVVILGASNVTLGFPRIVSTVRQMFPGSLQILAAHGHGRSYGRPSSVLGRTLPGIREAGLWKALDQLRQPGAVQPPLYAIITDVGNDLLYGAMPEQIVGWVDECLQRLHGYGAGITIGRLPLFALNRVGRVRFEATRTFFFPMSRLTHERMLIEAPQLDELLVDRAKQYGGKLFEPRPEWYGFDPIHIRRASRGPAWQEALSMWLQREGDAGPSPRFGDAWRFWRLRAAERKLFGRPLVSQQPAWQWPDGSTLSLY